MKSALLLCAALVASHALAQATPPSGSGGGSGSDCTSNCTFTGTTTTAALNASATVTATDGGFTGQVTIWGDAGIGGNELVSGTATATIAVMSADGGFTNTVAAKSFTSSVAANSSDNSVVVNERNFVCLNGTTCNYKVYGDTNQQKVFIISNGATVASWNGVSGDTETSFGIKLGSSGTTIQDSYSVSSTQDFSSIAANTCSDSSSIAKTGVAVNDGCVVGPAAAIETGLVPYCFVGSTNNFILRLCNITTGAIDPASQVFTLRSIDP